MYPEPSTAQILTLDADRGARRRLSRVRKESRNLSLQTPGMEWAEMLDGARPVVSGVRVNQGTAMRIAAVYACVAHIANYVAARPAITYRTLDNTGNGRPGKERATKHPLYNILKEQPNPHMRSFELKRLLTGHALLWGNAYAEVERNEGGQVIALWPMRPDRMRVALSRDGLSLFYFYTFPDAEERPLREVLHIKDLNTSDGLMGASRIQFARETIGLALAEEEYRARFLNNNATPGGVLKHQKSLSKEAKDRLRGEWASLHSGVTNAHRVAVLEEGLDWQSIGIPAKDMEFIEGRKFQKAEIATLFGVKPYKIGILESGTVSYASVEAQQIDNHIDTMLPWLKLFEGRFNMLFLGEAEQNMFVEFLVDDVLRGDSKTRAETLEIWKKNGVINANEWRLLENMNPRPDEGGDEYDDQKDAGESDDSDAEPLVTAPANGNGARHVNGHAR